MVRVWTTSCVLFYRLSIGYLILGLFVCMCVCIYVYMCVCWGRVGLDRGVFIFFGLVGVRRRCF